MAIKTTIYSTRAYTLQYNLYLCRLIKIDLISDCSLVNLKLIV